MTKSKPDKKIIGFDMDGVILDNYDVKLKLAKRFGFDLKLGHTPSEILKTMMPHIVWEEIQKLLYDNSEIALSVPLMKGIKATLSALDEKKIPYFLISRRKIPEVAINILKKHKLWPKHFHGNNSFFVNEPRDKNNQAIKLGLTHYIDDELKVINVLSDVPNRYLFDPFNAFDKADNYTKLKSWSEFKKYIK